MEDKKFHKLQRIIREDTVYGAPNSYEIIVKHDNEKYYIMKIHNVISFQSPGDEQTKEIENLKKLRNKEFVINLMCVYTTPSTYNLVFQLYSEIDLKKLMDDGVIGVKAAKFYFIEALLGLTAIHKEHLIYRNLSPSKIYIGYDGHALIGDFSNAVAFNEINRESEIGNYRYEAPEIWQKLPFDHKIDIWALGVIFYQMLQHVLPFDGPNLERQIRRNKVDYNKHISIAAKEVIELLLIKDPIARPGSIDDLLKLKYFKDIESYQSRTVPPPKIPEEKNFRGNFLTPHEMAIRFAHSEFQEVVPSSSSSLAPEEQQGATNFVMPNQLSEQELSQLSKEQIIEYFENFVEVINGGPQRRCNYLNCDTLLRNENSARGHTMRHVAAITKEFSCACNPPKVFADSYHLDLHNKSKHK